MERRAEVVPLRLQERASSSKAISHLSHGAPARQGVSRLIHDPQHRQDRPGTRTQPIISPAQDMLRMNSMIGWRRHRRPPAPPGLALAPPESKNDTVEGSASHRRARAGAPPRHPRPPSPFAMMLWLAVAP